MEPPSTRTGISITILGIEGEFRYVKDGKTNIYEKTYEIGPRYSRTSLWTLLPMSKVSMAEESSTSPIRIRRSSNLAYNMLGLGGGLDYEGPSFLNVRGSMNTNAGLASSQRPDAHGRYTSAPPIGFTRLASWTRKAPEIPGF